MPIIPTAATGRITQPFTDLRLSQHCKPWLIALALGIPSFAAAQTPSTALTAYTSTQAHQASSSYHARLRFKALDHSQIDLIGGQWATVQDQQGFIWFGGAGGVARYDGYNLELYRHSAEDKNSLSNNYVTDLLVDSDGQLWVTTLWGLNRYDAENNHFIRFEHNASDASSLNHNWVWNIAQDSKQNFWLATDGGGLAFLPHNGTTFTRFKHDANNTNTVPSDALLTVYVDSHDNVWLGAKEKGLSRYNPATQQFTHYPAVANDATSLSNGKVNSVFEDNQGRIWVGTDDGLNLLNAQTGTFTQYRNDPNNPRSLSGNLIRNINQDSNENLWIATDGGGLSIYRGEQEGFDRYTREAGKSGGPINNKIRSIFEDAQGGLWFGHYPAGISQLDRYASAFSNFQNNPFDDNSLSNSDILSVTEDRHGDLWVGTEGGLNHIALRSGKITRYLHQANNPTTVPADPVTAVVEDPNGTIWLGTWGGGFARYQAESDNFKQYKHNPSKPNSLRDNVVRTLLVDSNGDIWLGGGHGISRYRPSSDDFEHYTHDAKNPNSILSLGVNAIFEDSRGDFWVGGDLGLHRMNRRTGRFERFEHEPDNLDSLSQGYISAIGEDSSGHLWIATGANGLNRFNRENKTFEHFTTKNGLPDDRVGGIISDDNGFIWFGTGRGLSRFNPKDNSFKTYTQEHGLPGSLYKRPTCIKTRSGDLVFGSSKGLTLFNPQNIAQNTVAPPVEITGFDIFNRPVAIAQEGSPLKRAITQTQAITLNYQQSVFSFDFAALNYTMPHKNEYAYQLEGFDKDWVQAGDRRTTTYTNLDAGDYTFRVRGSNNEGIWNNTGDAISITILPPPWKTWWAYTLYALAVIGALALFVRAQQRKLQRAEEKIAMEQAVIQRLEHLDSLKDDFLANTSHELRTPINGIIGLAETLMGGAAGPINDELKSNLNMISISGRRLAHLVNDILDFSKLKNNNITIHPKPINVRAVADIVLTLCKPSTKAKPVTLKNNIDKKMPAALADDNRLQQVFYNLIGNAIKFTQAGTIEVSSTLEEDKVWIHVKDTGIGIPEDMLEKIFVAFEQVEQHENRSHGGTGLGLTVTRQIVELLGGEIRVISKENEGSTFSFSLPITDKYADDSLPQQSGGVHEIAKCLSFDHDADTAPQVETTAIKQNDNKSTEPQGTLINEENISDNARFKILIVDDDAINRKVLVNQLSLKNYSLETASNGADALEYIEKRGPFDLVLLDIMMPEMSGYEVCSRIRVYYSIQELPIIFLTAKNLITDLADGFQLGANDFLTKPISIGELTSRVRTHLELLDINRNLEGKVKQRTQEVTLANRELQTLDTIVSTIHQELRFDRLLNVILKEAMTLFPTADRASYWNYESEQDLFKLLSPKSLSEPNEETPSGSQRSELLSPAAIQERYTQNGKNIAPHIYYFTRNDIELIAPATLDILEAKSALVMTMILDDKIVGILVLASNASEDTFTTSKATTLERFRAHVVSALSKSNLVDLLEKNCNKLEHISSTDQLTGLRNRHYLYNHIEIDIKNLLEHYQIGARTKTSTPDNEDYTFFIIDIDHFKAINDTYGHVAGDRILQRMGNILMALFRETDYCIRWGGEEFLIITRFSSRSKAAATAEKIRSAIDQHTFDIDDDLSIKNTCSIGFASYPFLPSNPGAHTWEQVLDIADTCLYAAKNSQRNAWVGLYASEGESNTDIVPSFLNNPEQALDSNKVFIKSSIAVDKVSGWKK